MAVEPYRGIVSLKIDGVEIAGRMSDVAIHETIVEESSAARPDRSVFRSEGSHASMNFEARAHLPPAPLEFEGNFYVQDEQLASLLEMVGDDVRRRHLAQEIVAAECELFAAVMRYWVYF